MGELQLSLEGRSKRGHSQQRDQPEQGLRGNQETACLGDPTETFQAGVPAGLGEKRQKQLDWHIGPSAVEGNGSAVCRLGNWVPAGSCA